MESLPKLHSTFIKSLIDLLNHDNRIDSLLGAGSMIHGGFDEYSDIDLIIVIKSEFYSDVMSKRKEFANSLNGLLSSFTGEHVGEPRLLICLYSVPELLHVDLKFVNIDHLNQGLIENPIILWTSQKSTVETILKESKIDWPNQSSQWFEDRAWIWLHYATAKVLRGELYEAIGMLAFFREKVLGPLIHRRLSRSQRGMRKIDFLDFNSKDTLLQTIATYSKQSIISSLKKCIELYIDLRQDQPPLSLIKGMPNILIDMIDS
ncbi:hypothetical protein CYY_004988 [Polysphondylium violaceum]|uniref:Polymerase nucleotidyl transferase domain-containing protein n=1 Tax=Polysphondylium violaceum TaxID=133409 RepID=A0A8J4PV03_9MYCE|nr:hypothetical protein CYY_004988 [Polysphondylium violaceum]